MSTSPNTDITFHLVAAEEYRATDRSVPYIPAAYDSDGFIHCTDGAENVAEVGNRYYRDDRRMYIVLVIDKSRVSAEIRYEDAAGIYPHIYGALDRDAIIDIVPVLREADGAFQPPNLTPPSKATP